jgi:hypothetical protein
MPLVGPSVKFWITAAGTCFRHASRPEPGAWAHPTAAEKLLNDTKDGMGDVETCAKESIMAARNGALPGLCREIAELTD